MRCLVAAVSVLALLSGADALRPIIKGATHKGTTLAIKQRPPRFVPTADGSHGSREGMGWRQAGNTIPMKGGTNTYEAFFTQITVGTGNGGKGVTFDTIVDTGSSNTAVPGPNCPTCGTSHTYNPADSKTSTPLGCNAPMCQNCIPTRVGSAAVPTEKQDANTCMFGQPQCNCDVCAFSISYGGSGTATHGQTYLDYACLGEICSNEVYINAFTNQYPPATQTTGILGLAFPHNSCTPNCQPTFLDVLADKQIIDPAKNGFGMCLTPSSGGFIDLGDLNSTRYDAGTMQYTSVYKEHWYNIEVKAMNVNGTAIDVPSFLYNIVNDGIGAFPDSGTTVVLVSPYAFGVLASTMTTQYSNLKGVNTLFGGSCAALSSDDVASYPEMSFTVAGMSGQPDFEVKMNGQQYLMPDGNGNYCLGIAGVPSIGAILGDVIMQNYYIHFDRVGARVGFAPLKPGMC